MSNKANVRSIDALRKLRVAMLRFENEARRSSSAMVVEAQRGFNWLQQEQPQYWKRQVQVAYQQLAEARAMLMKCKMRRTGDFRPTCYDEQKAVQRCKKRLELSRNMVEVIRGWAVKSSHEFDEYTARSSQLNRCLDGDIPRAVALLDRLVESLERYADLQQGDSIAAFYAEAASEDPENQGEQIAGADGGTDSSGPQKTDADVAEADAPDTNDEAQS